MQSQATDPTGDALNQLNTSRYLDKVNDQTSRLDNQLTQQSGKYIQEVASEENKLKARLQKVDSSAARSLFGDVTTRYQQLQTGLLQNNGSLLRTGPLQYMPSLDSLKNTLLFLQTNKGKLNNFTTLQAQNLSAAIAKVQSLQDKLNAVDNLKTWMDQRKQYLTQQLGQFGMVKDLSGMNSKVAYYKQQVNDLKASFNDPSKIRQQAVNVLSQLPAYKNFISQHSYLASLFGQPETYNLTDSSMKGLQTRAVVQKMIQDKISTGGPNAEAQVGQQVQLGVSTLSQLKGKLTQLGNSNNPQDPSSGFQPNSQKTKSLWKRLEYGANLQFEPSSGFLPTICDIGLSLGYKLNNRATIGVGAAYKMGLGDGIQQIRISNQGVSLRSYIDWQLKKSLYLSGGYEQNYLSEFQSIGQLRVLSAWQQSGLIGLSRKYQISDKVKGQLQLLFDFLSYNQVPRAQPIVFRTGWTF